MCVGDRKPKTTRIRWNYSRRPCQRKLTPRRRILRNLQRLLPHRRALVHGSGRRRPIKATDLQLFRPTDLQRFRREKTETRGALLRSEAKMKFRSGTQETETLPCRSGCDPPSFFCFSGQNCCGLKNCCRSKFNVVACFSRFEDGNHVFGRHRINRWLWGKEGQRRIC
jgi:hypothetical protein